MHINTATSNFRRALGGDLGMVRVFYCAGVSTDKSSLEEHVCGLIRFTKTGEASRLLRVTLGRNIGLFWLLKYPRNKS